MSIFLKYIMLILFSFGLVLNAEIIKMEDGSCYERQGNINYITPCPRKKNPNLKEVKQPTEAGELKVDGQAIEKSNKCLFKIGEFSTEFLELKANADNRISCDDSREYINTMSLGYDASLKYNKVKIGDLVVKKGLFKCRVGLYYGDFMTIGLMYGDRLMCDDFMVYHTRSNRRRY